MISPNSLRTVPDRIFAMVVGMMSTCIAALPSLAIPLHEANIGESLRYVFMFENVSVPELGHKLTMLNW